MHQRKPKERTDITEAIRANAHDLRRLDKQTAKALQYLNQRKITRVNKYQLQPPHPFYFLAQLIIRPTQNFFKILAFYIF